MPRSAYTLLELLAVIVLFGLISSLGLPPLLRAITGDPLARATSRLTGSFRDARAQAYGQHLSLDLEGWGFSAATLQDGQRTSLATVRLPETIHVSWTRDGQSVRLLELDPRGHGLDTGVILRHDDREMAFIIDGLTGAWRTVVR